jgi:shikimate dehydrogenase
VDRVLQQKPAALDVEMRAIFARLPKAKLRAALIGSGIRESRTPGMHMAEGARLNLDYSYSSIDFDALGFGEDALEALLGAAAAHGFAGLNVTHPFKENILAHLDDLSREAEAIGAVNTVVFARGRAIGHNTDCFGFAESFRSSIPDGDLARVLLLGAGGAGKAVGRALTELGARQIDVFDLDRSRAEDLTASLQAQGGLPRAAAVDDVAEAARRATGIVNATPVGMAKYPGMPLPEAALRRDQWIADIVYFPPETALLRTASLLGCRTLPGKGMAVFQAVRAFELITGCKADPESMFRHFDAAEQPAPCGGPTVDMNELFRPF